MRARVDTNGQGFFNQSATTRTHLGRVARVNCYHAATGPFCLVRRVLYQLIPGGVTDAFIQAVPALGLHLLNVQVLKGDELVAVHQLPAELVGEIPTAVGYSFMDMLDNSLVLAIFGRAFFGFTQAALRLSECLFVTPEKAGILDFLTRAKGSKGFQAHIYTNYSGHRGQGFGRELAREASVPVTKTIVANSQCLDGSDDGAVQLNFHVTDFREPQPTIRYAKAGLRVGERIVTVMTSKAGIARGLSVLDAAKEGLKGKVKTHTDILQNLRMHRLEGRMFPLESRNHLDGVVQRYRLLPFLPGIPTMGQHVVIQPATFIQRLLQDMALFLGRIESVLVSLHTDSIARFYVSVNSHKRRDLRGSMYPRLESRGFIAPSDSPHIDKELHKVGLPGSMSRGR